MPQFNKMLNIMPYNCTICVQGYLAMKHVSEEAVKYGLYLIELMKTQAEKEPVWNALLTEDPIFVNGFGHGNNSTYTGDSMTPIFTSLECGILAGRVVYLLSCLTANELGPAAINIGAVAYGGYNIPWTWMTDGGFETEPYTDWMAEAFYRSSNEFPVTLIHGETVDVARARCITEYNKWINVWETERSDDKYAAEVIKWLIYDRDGLVVLGNTLATIVVSGTLTSMVTEVAPPNYVKEAGETFLFEGILRTYETKTPLPNRIVELWETEGITPIASTITNAEARWGFMIALNKGVHLLYAKFLGDETYSPASTSVYRIEVGIIIPKIFGNTAKEYSYVTYPANQIRGTWFTCPEPAVANSITFWIESEPPLGTYIRFAIYKRSDNSLVGYTEEAVNPPKGYLTLNITFGGVLKAGDYWLVIWSDKDISTVVHEEEGRAGMCVASYNSFPNFWSPRTYSHVKSIYCTYTPTPFVLGHTLTVNSVPLTGIPVTINGIKVGVTPIAKTLEEGEHLLTVPEEILVEGE